MAVENIATEGDRLFVYSHIGDLPRISRLCEDEDTLVRV